MLDAKIESADTYSGAFMDLNFERRMSTSSNLFNTVIKNEINYKASFKLSKYELWNFDGNLKKWPLFMN